MKLNIESTVGGKICQCLASVETPYNTIRIYVPHEKILGKVKLGNEECKFWKFSVPHHLNN